MCFSAHASVLAGSSLIAAGALSVGISQSNEDRLVASVPLLFGVQQLIEGGQWMAVDQGVGSQSLGYAFLFFAFLFWPIYVPWVMTRIDPKRITRHRYFLGLGVLVSLYLLGALLSGPMTISTLGRHIAYEIFVPMRHFVAFLYVVAVCGPMWSASRPEIQTFGWFFFFSALLSAIWFTNFFTSVWCFFAAVLSLLIYVHLYTKKYTIV